MTFVLDALTVSLFLAIHMETLATSLLSTSLTSDTVGALYIIAVSSAYKMILLSDITLGKSLIKQINSSGPQNGALWNTNWNTFVF